MKPPTEKLSDRIGQFTTIPNTVIALWPKLGTDAIALFLYLRYRSDEHDESFPSYQRMRRDTGMTRQRIADALRVLEQYGLLERSRRFSNSTVYTLKLPPISPPPGPLDGKAGDGQPPPISPPPGLMGENAAEPPAISPDVGLHESDRWTAISPHVRH